MHAACTSQANSSVTFVLAGGLSVCVPVDDRCAQFEYWYAQSYWGNIVHQLAAVGVDGVMYSSDPDGTYLALLSQLQLVEFALLEAHGSEGTGTLMRAFLDGVLVKTRLSSPSGS